MIGGFVQKGCGEFGVDLNYKMRKNGLTPDEYTFASVFRASDSLATLENGKRAHGILIKSIIRENVVVSSALMDMYFKCSSITDGHQVFDKVVNRNVVTWTSLISGYGPHGRVIENGLTPDKYTFASVFRASDSLATLEHGKQAHGILIKSNIRENVVVSSALMDRYFKCSSITDGRQNSLTPDEYTFASVFRASDSLATLEHGNSITDGRQVFDKVVNRNVVTWTSLISGYGPHGRVIENSLTPDEYTFASVFRASDSLATLEHGNSITDGRQVFDKVVNRNVVTWTSLISGYGPHGRVIESASDSLATLEHGKRAHGILIKSNIRENVVVSSALMDSHGGLVDGGWHYFLSMTRDYRIQPRGQHYAAMVDLFGRSGKLHEAYKFVLNSPCKDHLAIWGALLGAFRIDGDMDLIKLVADKDFELDPENAGTFVVLSNAYATFDSKCVEKCTEFGDPVNRTVAVIKSNKDTRYGLDSIVTHDGMKLPCWALENLSSFKQKIGPDAYDQLDVIGIDEAQFFEDLYDFCCEAADHDGKTVIVAGLDGDYLRRSFGSVLDIIPLADSVMKLTARCELCGKRAFFTLRKTDETQTELIGGADVYMPVCRQHYVNGQVVIKAARSVLESQKLQSGSYT
ncbi:hypothetical protein CRYUN_Cryun32bG0014300 [Craigia yunnanensis]